VSSANTKWYSNFLMALILDSQGEKEQAVELSASVGSRALAMQNPPLIGLSSAFQAELDLRQGRLGKALAWARSHEPTLKGNWWRWYLPDLTYVRALMAEGSADNLKLARKVMTGLDSRFRVLHNRRMLIDVLALRASLEVQLQDPDAALTCLGEAIELARPYDIRRPFLDLGDEIVSRLEGLSPESPDRDWVEGIMASRTDTKKTPSASPPRQRGSVSSIGDEFFEPLTNRELDVLELLAERLTNKEIGSRLHISSATVKRHTVNIYEKIGVGGRREAVAKAEEFGIL
jgi:LuxR family maltose regulon positive regulatory protein